MPKIQQKYFHYTLLLVLIYFVVFLKLDGFHIRWWDESMFAVNTYEMLHNGKYFSLYFNGMPDLFNTKPPLNSWLQLVFVKLIGYNELAIRLPSALGTSFTVLLFFHFLSLRMSRMMAWISTLILLCSYGFIHFHTARTGDADAVLTFFLFAATYQFLNYTYDNKHQRILLFFAFISLAFSAKMFASLLFCPAYLLILIRYGKVKQFVFNKHFIAGLLLFLISGIGIVCLRETDTPGYLKEIFFKDAGRIFSVVEGHRGSPDFYFENLFTVRFSYWAVLFLTGCLFIFIATNKSHRQLLVCTLTLTLSYLLIISFSVTKLEWYDMPLYPLLALIAAYPLYWGYKQVIIVHEPKQIMPATLVFLLVVFAYPYILLVEKAEGNTIKNGEKTLEANERYLFRRNKENKNLNGIKVYTNTYEGSLLFYKYKLAELHQKIEMNHNGIFDANDKVLVSNDSLYNVLCRKYEFIVLDSLNNAKLMQLKKIGS